MNTPPSIDVLKEQFERQNAEFSQLKKLLGAFDTRLALEVDSATLRAFDDAIEAASVPPAVTLLPGLGLRA